MSTNHITEEEFRNQERDEFWKRCFTEQSKLLKIKLEEVQRPGVRLSTAENYAESLFNAEFSDEMDHLPQWSKNCSAARQQIVEEQSRHQQIIDNLRKQGRDKEATGRRLEIPPHEKKRMIVYEVAAWGFYLAGLAATAIFLHDQAGFEWWKAVLFPIAGVSALVFGLKAILSSLAGHRSTFAPAAKYATGVLGMVCAVGWLFYYAEFAGSISAGPQFESLDGSSAAPEKDRGPIIMIVLGVLAEALIAAFLFQVASDIRQRFEFHDAVVETQEFSKAKADLEACIKKLEWIDSRCSHADALVTILRSAKQRLVTEARMACEAAPHHRS